MTTYQITSTQGTDFGTYTADSPEQALVQLHRDAGYNVRFVDGQIVYPDPHTAGLCGGADDWHIEEVA